MFPPDYASDLLLFSSPPPDPRHPSSSFHSPASPRSSSDAFRSLPSCPTVFSDATILTTSPPSPILATHSSTNPAVSPRLRDSKPKECSRLLPLQLLRLSATDLSGQCSIQECPSTIVASRNKAGSNHESKANRTIPFQRPISILHRKSDAIVNVASCTPLASSYDNVSLPSTGTQPRGNWVSAVLQMSLGLLYFCRHKLSPLNVLRWALSISVDQRPDRLHVPRIPNDLTTQIVREGLDPVASGGFADIYRGFLESNAKSLKVAIKAIKTYSGEEGDISKKQRVTGRFLNLSTFVWMPAKPLTQRLRREIKVWLTLEHENVLPLLGTTMGFGRFPAMVCPWAEKGTLASYLRDRHVDQSEIEILGLLDNVASGLHYLHSRSVVHGDLSGSNILVDEHGNACIADFGLSTLLTELEGLTFATSFHARGTMRWIAPELLDLSLPEDELEEGLAKISPKTYHDVYSFGGVMLQILSGLVPYHYYTNEMQVVHAVSRGITPKRPGNVLVTDRRWAFIQQCWSKLDVARSRPSSDEIVQFTHNELSYINAI